MKRILIAVALASLAMGCGDWDSRVAKSWHQESIPVSKKFFGQYGAIYQIDHNKMGFPPLPTNGSVKVETVHRDTWAMEYPPPKYDVMLHFCDDPPSYRYTYRTVGLKTVEGQYRWIAEQQSFHGPKRYTTVDGTFNEQITLTCENEQVAFVGTNLTGTSVMYSGPDVRLTGKGQHADNLTIGQVAPILREWGYNYDMGNAQPSVPADADKPRR